MYATDHNLLPAAVIERIEALEQELDVPIILAGCALGTNEDSRLVQWRANANCPEELWDGSVVVLIGGMRYAAQFAYQSNIPDALLLNSGGQYRNPYGDFLVGIDAVTPDRFLTCGNVVEITPGVVGFGMWTPSWHEGRRARMVEAIDWDRVLIDPIRASLDADHFAALLAEAQQRSRQQFIELMNSRNEARFTDLRNLIRQSENNIVSWNEHIATATTNLRDFKAQLDVLDQAGKIGEDELTRRWDELAEHPRITDIQFEAQQLRLVTDHMHMRHPYSDATRWLGRFSVLINLTNNVVRIANLDNKKGDRDHPHVPGGAPCFGAAQPLIVNLLAQREYAAFIELLIQFLETFNPDDDYGQYAAWWFEVDDEDPAKRESDTAEAEAVVA